MTERLNNNEGLETDFFPPESLLTHMNPPSNSPLSVQGFVPSFRQELMKCLPSWSALQVGVFMEKGKGNQNQNKTLQPGPLPQAGRAVWVQPWGSETPPFPCSISLPTV